MSDATRAEICAVACAEAYRDNGEVIASAFGTIPAIGVRLARHTFSPDLMISDGEATAVRGTWAVGSPAEGDAEAWLPFNQIFTLVWNGKRHITMIPTQIDAFGNANISAIGDHAKPKVQLLGVRGAPGNSVYHPTSYWVPKHSVRSFVPKVDMVSGVGNDRARELGTSLKFHHLGVIITNLAVFGFDETGRVNVRSIHPGVDPAEVVAQTGFAIDVSNAPATRLPDAEELRLIREVIDPRGARSREVAN